MNRILKKIATCLREAELDRIAHHEELAEMFDRTNKLRKDLDQMHSELVAHREADKPEGRRRLPHVECLTCENKPTCDAYQNRGKSCPAFKKPYAELKNGYGWSGKHDMTATIMNERYGVPQWTLNAARAVNDRLASAVEENLGDVNGYFCGVSIFDIAKIINATFDCTKVG